MVRLLIEDVTLIKRDEITALVRFRGGATTSLELPLPLNAWQGRTTPPHVVAKVDELLAQRTDGEVAELLNQCGLRTGADAPFTSNAVKWVRSAYDIKSFKERLQEQGWLPTSEYAAKIGVHQATLKKWRKKGIIHGRTCNDSGDWLFAPGQSPPSGAKRGGKPSSITSSTPQCVENLAGGAV